MEGRMKNMKIDQERKKVPVVYYLSRNINLEHPHFIEVPCSSEGLFLRDVIIRLNLLRGKGMAGMYSWSCKRLYKGGFVWQDLSEDDLIPPAKENEYVLKGSQRMDMSSPDNSKAINRAHGVSPSSSSPKRRPKPSSPSTSTQTEERAIKVKHRTRGVSTEEPPLEIKFERRSDISSEDISPPPTSSSVSSSEGKRETLESLIRGEERKKKKRSNPTLTKSKARNPLIQIITCGSISVKDGDGVGVRKRMDGIFGEEMKRKRRERRVEEKEYFSGSVLEMGNRGDSDERFVPTLKRSSSCNAEMNFKLTEGEQEKTPGESGRRRQANNRTEENRPEKEGRKDLEKTEAATRRESKRFAALSLALKEPSSKSESFREKEKIFKIEERLTSGARVIIHSSAPCHGSEDSTSS